MVEPTHRDEGIAVDQLIPYFVVERLTFCNTRREAFAL